MAAEYGFLTGQGTDGQTKQITSSATTVHTVPTGEKHELTIIASATAAAVITTKPAGDSVGQTEGVEADKQRVVFTGVVTATGSSKTITCQTNTGTAQIHGKYRKLD